MAKLPPPKSKSKIERIRETYPRLADLIERDAALVARHEAVIAEINPAAGAVMSSDGRAGSIPLAEQGRRAMDGWVAQSPRPKPKPVERHAGAVELVGTLLSPQPESEINPPATRPAWPGEQRLRELGKESEAISEARKLLAPELVKARTEYSRLVVVQRSSDHREISSAIVDAARALGDAIVAQREFLNQARLDGVAYSLYRPIPTYQFGDLDQEGTPLLKVIRDATDLGHVTASKIPSWKTVDIAYLQNGN